VARAGVAVCGGRYAARDMTAHLTQAQARRVALAAQGFGRRPSAPPTMRHLQRVLDRTAQFQIDSVNVCVRAVSMSTRLGPTMAV
jgi:uncharacterized protein YcaQ